MPALRNRPASNATAITHPTVPSHRDHTSSELTNAFTRVAAGETAAFTELYDATAARVYGLALRIVRDPAQAEEVLQESYLQIWRTAQRFDPLRGSAISWVLRIAHSAAVNRVRSAQASTSREETYQREVQPVAHVWRDITFDRVHDSFEARRVHQALTELPAVQRQAVELAYFGGYTHSEIARCLELPLGTAKYRIRSGLLRLRDLLVDR